MISNEWIRNARGEVRANRDERQNTSRMYAHCETCLLCYSDDLRGKCHADILKAY